MAKIPIFILLILTFLKSISKKYFYDLEGVKIALRIDRAYLDFQKELYLEGNTGFKQFLNFLKHEKCRITIEEDIDRVSTDYSGKYNIDPNKYKEIRKEEYTEKLKNINCWKEEYNSLNYTQIFRILKVAKVFHVLKTKIKIGEYSNEELLDLYSFLYKKSFIKNYENFREFLGGNTNKEKIAITKSILSIIFKSKPSNKRYSIIIE